MAYGSWDTGFMTQGFVSDSAGGSPYAVNIMTNVGYIIRVGTITPGFGKIKRLSSNKAASSTKLQTNALRYVRRAYWPHNGDLTGTSVLSGFWTHYSGAACSLVVEAPGGVTNPEPSLSDSLNDRVSRKILEKLKNQSVNLAQVFAERKMTADLIGSTATKLAAAFVKLRKGDFRGAGKQLGVSVSRRKNARFNSEYRKRNGGSAIADGWLELQYGWRPLLQDIYGSAEFLASKQTREVRAAVNSRININNKSTVTRNVPPGIVIDNTSYRYEVSSGVRYQTSGAELATIKEAGLINPLSVAWEITPWSFVVDWFIPVGNYINTLDATLGLDFQSGYRTIFQEGTLEQTAFGDGTRFGGTVWSGYCRATRKSIDLTRVKLEGFPEAGFPGFKNPFSFEHALNAIALMTQVMVTKKM